MTSYLLPDFDVELFIKRLMYDENLSVFPVHTVKSFETRTSSGKTNNAVCTCKNGSRCNRAGKHPFFNVSWKHLASNTIENLRKSTKNKLDALFFGGGGCTEFNLAVATGKVRASELSSGTTSEKHLVVIDVDASVHEILSSLPDTFSYRTGSGGYHFWFWSEVAVKNSVSKIYEKVDVRGTGGYVIVPPSVHSSGNLYRFVHGPLREIEPIPAWLLNRILETQTPQKDKTTGKKAPGANKTAGKTKYPLLGEKAGWADSTVKEIRERLNLGELIPCGLRNNTIHRLLSSDRAKGVASYVDLMACARKYVSAAETTEPFSDREIHGLVSSVMKYPAYNSVVENINKNYVKWMAKHHKVTINLDSLEKEDELFFRSLKKGENLVSLKQILDTRTTWFKTRSIKNFSRYKSQLIAKKLLELGFERKRTAKCNLWNVDLESVNTVTPAENFPVASTLMSCYGDSVGSPTSQPEINMTTTASIATASKKSANNDVGVSKTSTAVKRAKKKKVATKPPMTETVETAETVEVASPAQSEGSTPDTASPSGSGGGNGPIGPDGLPMKLLEEREDIIKTKRKYNPDDFRYGGLPSNQEILLSEVKFLADLDETQSAEFESGALLYDEDRTRTFFDFLESEDVLGFRTEMYKVVGKEGDSLSVLRRAWNKYENKYTFTPGDDGDSEKLSLYELDNALSIGFCQLLYRNGVPFGMDEDLEYKVKVQVYVDSYGRTYMFKSGKEVSGKEKSAKQPEAGESSEKSQEGNK